VISLDSLSKYLLIVEHRFGMMLCSNLANENSDATHVKCSCGTHLARGSQVTQPWLSVLNIIKPGKLLDKLTREKA